MTTRGISNHVGRCAIVLALLGAAAATGAPALAAEDELTTYLTALRDEIDLPGAAVAVLDGDDVVREELLGEDGAGRPLSRDTPHLVGSVAKSMTATLVLQQVERGRLDLDQRIGAHLPWLHDTDATVRQLLTHTSGYTAADGLAVSERFDDRPGAVRRAAADLRLTGTGGTYAYSSANYLVLGALVEELAGRPFAEVLQRDLLDPLDMDDTSGAAEGGRDLPPGHQWWFGRARVHDAGTDESGAPYGYVVSTLADLETYAAAQAGARPDVLAPGLLDALHRPRVAADDDRYGFGWRVAGDGSARVVHHTGATPGFFAHVLTRPSDGRSVVVLADAYGEAQAPVLAAVAHDVLAITDGGSAVPAGVDPVLGAAPWAVASTALAGVVLAVAAWRRRSGRRWGRVLASAAVVGLLTLLPRLLGTDLGQLRTWAPDTAVALGCAVAGWLVVTAVLLLDRGHRAPAGTGSE